MHVIILTQNRILNILFTLSESSRDDLEDHLIISSSLSITRSLFVITSICDMFNRSLTDVAINAIEMKLIGEEDARIPSKVNMLILLSD